MTSTSTNIYSYAVYAHPAFNLFDTCFRCECEKPITNKSKNKFKVLMLSQSEHNEQLRNLVTNYFNEAFDACVNYYVN